MKKIISLFKRNYDGNRLVYNEVVPGGEWVINGEGIATEKFNGTACMVEDGKLYKRYDRKLSKAKRKQLKQDNSYIPQVEDYKPAPEGWLPAEKAPDQHTGHWPGWVPVGDGPEDKWHREAWYGTLDYGLPTLKNGTYELVGPKVQGNPYNLKAHHLWRHGSDLPYRTPLYVMPPRGFEELRLWFELASSDIEGIVWHHEDGRMVKIKSKDFGL